MSKFRNALYRFMYGRNGVDALSWALVVLEVVLSLLSSFIHVRGVSQALYFVSTALMFVVLLRIFSRDLLLHVLARLVRLRNLSFYAGNILAVM